MPPHVGWPRKQNGGYIQCISVQNADITPGDEFYSSKDT